MNFQFQKNQKGQLLVEAILAIGVAVVIMGLGAQFIYVSLKANRSNTDRDIAVSLQKFSFDAARSVASQRWLDLYNTTKDSGQYHFTSGADGWSIQSGALQKVYTVGNTVTFQQYVTFQNVCRDATGNIMGITDTNGTEAGAATACEGTADPNDTEDPSTQKINSFVSWGINSPTESSFPVTSEYVTRTFQNATCTQTDWSGGVGSGAKTCPDTTYETQTNITATTSLTKSGGGGGSDLAGVLVYDETTPTTNFQQRAWSQNAAVMGAESSNFAGTGAALSVRIKSARTRQEMIMGVWDNSGTGFLTIYRSTDKGVTWSQEWTAVLTIRNTLPFDIAYETNSDDFLIFYSSNATANPKMLYQTYNPTAGWSGAQSYSILRNSPSPGNPAKSVDSITMTPNPNASSNEIAVAWIMSNHADSDLSSSGNVWNGSAMPNTGEPSAVFTNSNTRAGASSTSHNNMQIVYESQTQRAMFIFSVHTNQVLYKIRETNGAWGATTTLTLSAVTATFVMEAQGSLVSNRIAFATYGWNLTVGHCRMYMWDGSTWSNTGDNTCRALAPPNGTGGTSVTWLYDSVNATEAAVYTYPDAAATTGIDWFLWKTGDALPVQQTDITSATVNSAPCTGTTGVSVSGNDQSAKGFNNPQDTSRGMIVFSNDASDGFVKQVSLSNTTVCWNGAEPGGVSFETSLISTVRDSVAAFEYDRSPAGVATGTLTSAAFDTNPGALTGLETPDQIFGTDLKAWVRADYGTFQDTGFTTPANPGDPVGGIQDKSTNGNHYTEITNGQRPTLTTVGANRALRFDGIDDQMIAQYDLAAGNFLVAVIYAATSSVPYQRTLAGDPTNWLIGPHDGIYQAYNGTNFVPGAKPVVPGQVILHEVSENSGNTTQFIDGENRGTLAGGQAPHLVNMSKAACCLQPFGGDIYEIVIVPRLATAGELARLNAYASVRYGISLIGGTPISDGVAFNSILWKGTLNTGKVRFQIATSNNPAGPWDFIGGATCTNSDWFDPGAADTPVGISCDSTLDNKQFYKYKVQICSATDCTSTAGTSPSVDDVIISWSP